LRSPQPRRRSLRPESAKSAPHVQGTELAEGNGRPAISAGRESTLNPTGTTEAGTTRTRRHASAAILAWITILLLGAAIGSRQGNAALVHPATEIARSVPR